MTDLFTKPHKPAVPIGDFMTQAKAQVESHLPPCWIGGEVADFTCAKSGHWYFVLRDQNAQADCIMLRPNNMHARLALKDGDAIEVMAQPSIYAPRGRFQLAVRLVRLTGAGRLHQEYMQRKSEWAERGWFAAANKKTPPFLPAVIGVVGSMQGAAVRDILRTLKSRMPSIDVIIYPSPAQGADASGKIAHAIETANRRRECDVLIVCRGGGGMEDLWAYNEEATVAAIVQSQLPIITGIGHEVDETLADFAADVRAPTPTAAAVAAAPECTGLRAQCNALARRVAHAASRLIQEQEQRLDYAIAATRRPANFWRNKNEVLSATARRFVNACREDERRRQLHLRAIARLRLPDFSAQQSLLQQLSRRLPAAAARAEQQTTSHLQNLQSVMQSYHPTKVVARGYGIVRDSGGRIVTTAESLTKGDSLHITLAKGAADAIVQKTMQATGDNKLKSES